MARKRPSFVCQECGTAHGQWVGKCDGCGAWNSLVEESTEDLNPGGLKNRSAKGKAIEFADLQAKSTDVTRHLTGIGVVEYEPATVTRPPHRRRAVR